MDENRTATARENAASAGLTMLESTNIGEPLFVINLCAAMTPIDLNANRIAGLEQYRLYQVSRMEDGRRRYRLRLGFFPNESQAEDVLTSVRSHYATAFTSCLCEEDLKHATGYLKCSVEDLQRTGRYSVKKLRGDSSTTTVRALNSTARHNLAEIHRQAVDVGDGGDTARVAVLQPGKGSRNATKKDDAADMMWIAPEAGAQPWPKSAPEPKADSSTKHSQAKPSLAAQLFIAKSKLTQTESVEATPRKSLMRQAHAMAEHDAAERAKALEQTSLHAIPALSSDAADTAHVTKIPQRTRHAAQPDAVRESAKQSAHSRPAPVTRAPADRTPLVNSKPASSNPANSQSVHSKPDNSNQKDTAATGRFDTRSIVVEPKAVEELSASVPPVHTSKLGSHKTGQAFHVGAGAQIPDTAFTLEGSHHHPAPPTGPAQVKPIIDTSTTTDLLQARELARQSALWRQGNGETPTLDTTQTIRTLTKQELEATNEAKWFVVQLAISGQPANLDTMPRLDIFEAYSLYSVAVMENGNIRHALRLGFFREEVSAEAVLGYLKAFFADPTIERIPDAEHTRFADSPKIAPPMKPVGSEVTLEERQPKYPLHKTPIPTVDAEVARPTTSGAGRPMARSAAPATRNAKPGSATTVRRAAQRTRGGTPASQRDMLEEARALGLSDTQMVRVQKNPSLLARLVGKLGK